MEKTKQNLTGLSLAELEAFAESMGEKKFRGRQLFGWIYEKKASAFADMTNLAKSLRDKLSDAAAIGLVQQAGRQVSSESGTIKYLFRLFDDALIETVVIPESARLTCCISSQAGCAFNCSFCATGAMGFKRDLSAGEIVDQVIFAERDMGHEITNVVLMGMGEPLQNYDAVIKACRMLNSEDGLAIAGRRIVISTVGLVPAIYRYADEDHPYRLAISLHSAMDEKRKKILPIGRKYPLPELMAAVRYYTQKARQHPTFEYVLLAGVNDGQEDAVALRNLLKGIPCKVNLIPYNAAIPQFQAPEADHVNQFVQWLLPLQAPVSVRWSKGTDIRAACGQLVTGIQKTSPCVPEER
jgi:23S rRNA (adenine2503-C2)-methyltransferase